MDPSKAAANTCAHPRLHPGLDGSYCPDCQRTFGPRSSEYSKSALDNKFRETIVQAIDKEKFASGRGNLTYEEKVIIRGAVRLAHEQVRQHSVMEERNEEADVAPASVSGESSRPPEESSRPPEVSQGIPQLAAGLRSI